LLELDPDDCQWTPQPRRVNSIVREMRKDIALVQENQRLARRRRREDGTVVPLSARDKPSTLKR
jgi:hypothetical protein